MSVVIIVSNGCGVIRGAKSEESATNLDLEDLFRWYFGDSWGLSLLFEA